MIFYCTENYKNKHKGYHKPTNSLIVSSESNSQNSCSVSCIQKGGNEIVKSNTREI